MNDVRFKPLISTCWRENGDLIVSHKLQALKHPTKTWNKEVFGNIDHIIKALEGEVNALDILVDNKPLLEVEMTRSKALFVNLRKQRIMKFQVLK